MSMLAFVDDIDMRELDGAVWFDAFDNLLSTHQYIAPYNYDYDTSIYYD